MGRVAGGHGAGTLGDLAADDGRLLIGFGHPLDTIQRITIAPTAPPFRDSAGRPVRIAGDAFFRLTIRGLTQATKGRDDLRRTGAERLGGAVVAPPVAEARRVVVPEYRRPVDGPSDHASEVWIIGLDRPVCLQVETTRGGSYPVAEPGDDMVIVTFVPRGSSPASF